MNHWDVAIATHTANHPKARHHCVNLDAARPEDLVPDGSLDLLMASPECTYHSRARGGKPINDQLRMSPWHVQRWATTLDIRCILVENVPEFVDWGPLDENGRPDRAKKGLFFQAWIQALWAMGYDAQWKLLNAADFGDATTRTRFFLQARKDGQPIRWPEPSHQKCAGELFGQVKRWRAAREVIDWSQPGLSLIGRKRPLSIKTRLRIARGLVKFGGSLAPAYLGLLDLPSEDLEPLLSQVVDGPAQPFVLANRNNATAKSLDEPLPTATTATGGGVFRVDPQAEPFVLGQQSGAEPRSVEEPLPTIATAGAIAAIEPIVTPYYQHSTARTVRDPLPTITTVDRLGLCQPVIVPYGPKAEARSVQAPMPTIMTRDRLGVATPVAEPFILSQNAWNDGYPRLQSVDDPIYAITTIPRQGLVEPFLVPQFGERDGQVPRVHSIAEPIPAVTSHGAGCLVDPWIEAAPEAVDPMRVVLIDGVPHLLDIRFRMLAPRELARAMGFDDGDAEYLFTGNTSDVTKQIGNAVAVNTAKALVLAVLGTDDTREIRA